MPLEKVEKFIKEHKHLPGIEPAQVMEEMVWNLDFSSRNKHAYFLYRIFNLKDSPKMFISRDHLKNFAGSTRLNLRGILGCKEEAGEIKLLITVLPIEKYYHSFKRIKHSRREDKETNPLEWHYKIFPAIISLSSLFSQSFIRCVSCGDYIENMESIAVICRKIELKWKVRQLIFCKVLIP